MIGHGKRFESLVQLGLFVIIFVLLILNISSSYVVYRLWDSAHEKTSAQLRNRAITVSRALESFSEAPPDSLIFRLQAEHKLHRIAVLAPISDEASGEELTRWLAGLAEYLPESEIKTAADRIVQYDYAELMNGKEGIFNYVSYFPSSGGSKLLILSARSTELAYLEKAKQTLLISMLVAMLIIIAVYFMLSRFIVSPFKRIGRKAIEAGRKEMSEAADVDSVVEDYRRIIEELKAKEAELLLLNQTVTNRAERLEHFNQYLLGSTSSGIVTLEKDGSIKTINKAASEMLGVSAVDIIGSNWDRLFGAAGELSEAISDCISSNGNQSYQEFSFVTPAGKELMAGITISAIHDNRRETIGTSLVMNDMTEIDHLRTRLETNERLAALGEMAAGLAHQLRNSIGAISGYGKLVAKRLAGNGLSTDSADAIERELQEAEKLVGCFLDFARPLRLSPESINLTDCIEELIASLEVSDLSEHIEINFHSDFSGEIMIDKLLLKQALTNIIHNAINAYDGKAGVVDVSCRHIGDEVLIEIRDRGCGISRGDLKKIFTPFFSTRPSGTGLGLPLASKIIASHQGSIEVKSEIGVGTRLSVHLPVQNAGIDIRRQNEMAR